jgi:hypothetical protein
MIQEFGNVLHHVKHRGSGGTDDKWNLMPLTTEMHTRVHMFGLVKFAEMFSGVKKWLIENDWEYDDFLKKWVRK